MRDTTSKPSPSPSPSPSPVAGQAAIPSRGARRGRPTGSARAWALALPLVLARGLSRVLPVVVLAVALWAAPSARSAWAEVSDRDLEVCMAYAQIELATQYGSPSSLVFINDGRATMERYEGMVDGHYVSTILRLDGVLTPPDGVPRPVRVTCLLASVGEPVGLRLEPRR